MYDVNFVYNALSFLRLTLRSSVNHVFVVLNKHILYLVVAKFPTLFSSPFAGFLLWAQGTWTYQGPRCIQVHEVVVLLLGGFYQLSPSKVFSTEVLKDFHQRLFWKENAVKNSPLWINHWNTRKWNRRMRESAEERKRES